MAHICRKTLSTVRQSVYLRNIQLKITRRNWSYSYTCDQEIDKLATLDFGQLWLVLNYGDIKNQIQLGNNGDQEIPLYADKNILNSLLTTEPSILGMAYQVTYAAHHL